MKLKVPDLNNSGSAEPRFTPRFPQTKGLASDKPKVPSTTVGGKLRDVKFNHRSLAGLPPRFGRDS